MDDIIVDLATYRAQQGLSQKQLYTQAKISKTVLNTVELGIYPYEVRQGVLDSLAKVLGISPEEVKTLVANSRRLRQKKELLKKEQALVNI